MIVYVLLYESGDSQEVEVYRTEDAAWKRAADLCLSDAQEAWLDKAIVKGITDRIKKGRFKRAVQFLEESLQEGQKYIVLKLPLLK